MKKLIYFGAFFVFVVMISSFASANFLDDLYGKITGYSTSNATSLNISITANNAPTITWVESIPNQAPNEGGINTTTFNFTVNDSDGWENINVSIAQAFFNRTGEVTRSNTSCLNWSNDGVGGVNFTCSVDMWYFDGAGDWSINVTIEDDIGASGENSSTTFQYDLYKSMIMSPTVLAWTDFGVSDTNQGSSNDPIVVNNTGNAVDLSINVTGYDLEGEQNSAYYIYAANFTVENASTGCSGTSMLNQTSLNVTSSILQRGNNSLSFDNETSGQEQLYFCVTAVNSDLITQAYSSAAYGPWNILID